jgi:inner membrane protein
MLAKTHIAFGILLALLIVPLVQTGNKIIFFALVVFSSLLPDIDTPHSKLGSKIKPASWLIKETIGHRGLFHSLLFGIALHVLIWFFIGKIYATALIIGYFSHLLIDGFTKEGINFLHPIAELRLRGFVETGSFLEFVIFLSFAALIVIKVI